VFINKEAELQWVREYARRSHATPFVIYGPEGCGKTALALEAVRRFSSWYAGGIALYIDGKARRAAEAVKSNVNIGDVLAEVGGLAGSVGRSAARLAVWLLGKIVEKIAERFAPMNILVVDELFSAVGVSEGALAVKYAKELGDRVLRSKKAELGEIPKPLAEASVSYLIFSSEGSSRRELSRHNWAHIALMWNMGERGFQQLGEILGAPDFSAAWRLCGGQPPLPFPISRAGLGRGKIPNSNRLF